MFNSFTGDISAYSALLAALVAVVSLLLSIRSIKQRMRDECDRRVEELRLAFQEGLRYERRKDVP